MRVVSVFKGTGRMLVASAEPASMAGESVVGAPVESRYQPCTNKGSEPTRSVTSATYWLPVAKILPIRLLLLMKVPAPASSKISLSGVTLESVLPKIILSRRVIVPPVDSICSPAPSPLAVSLEILCAMVLLMIVALVVPLAT